MNPKAVAALIDAIDHKDPEKAHAEADAILLVHAGKEIADAYARLVSRCGWWATA